MKYSNTRPNVITIRNMPIGETILLKHGRRVIYKGGYTLVPQHFTEEDEAIFSAAQAIKYAKHWCAETEKQKDIVIVIRRANEESYNIDFAHHFSKKNGKYAIWSETCGYELLTF